MRASTPTVRRVRTVKGDWLGKDWDRMDQGRFGTLCAVDLFRSYFGYFVNYNPLEDTLGCGGRDTTLPLSSVLCRTIGCRCACGEVCRGSTDPVHASSRVWCKDWEGEYRGWIRQGMIPR